MANETKTITNTQATKIPDTLDTDYTPIEAYSLVNVSEEKWLELRKNGIGGSDASAIQGTSPWNSPLALYNDKKGIVPVSDNKNQMILDAGHNLENLVAQAYMYIMNSNSEGDISKPICQLYEKKVMYRHPNFPFMQADVDRLAVFSYPDGKEKTRIIEIKTTSVFNKDKWYGEHGEHTIPPEYVSQGRHYMSVMNISQVDYVCLFCDEPFRMIASLWDGNVTIPDSQFFEMMDKNIVPNICIRHLQRDMEEEKTLINQESDFWNNHILPAIPPSAREGKDGKVAFDSATRYVPTVGIIAKTEAKVEGEKKNEAEKALLRYTLISEKIADLKKQIKSNEKLLQSESAVLVDCFTDGGDYFNIHIGNEDEDDDSDYEVNYNVSYALGKESESILKKDQLKLKEQYPEIYDRFVTRKPGTRSLKVTERKVRK